MHVMITSASRGKYQVVRTVVQSVRQYINHLGSSYIYNTITKYLYLHTIHIQILWVSYITYSATWHIWACHIGEFCISGSTESTDTSQKNKLYTDYTADNMCYRMYLTHQIGERGIGFRFQYPKFPDMPSCTVLENFKYWQLPPCQKSKGPVFFFGYDLILL